MDGTTSSATVVPLRVIRWYRLLRYDGTASPILSIVWMDAIHYKVTDDRGYAVTRAIYNVLGIDFEGHKDLLGMYISMKGQIFG